jgi:putative transposase
VEQHATTIHKTYKYKLTPTPEQQRTLEMVLWRCRTLYNVALEQRRMWWDRGQGISATYFQQKAELPVLKAEFPELVEMHSQVLQDVLLRLDRAFQQFFRRVQAGETPGYPRFQARTRYHSFTYPQFTNGARLENGFLVLAKIGRLGVRWSRPLQGTPKTVTISREADGWYVCFSCTGVPAQPLPLTGRETGIDVGLKVFLVTADGGVVENPRHYRRGEQRLARAQRRVSRRTKGSNRRTKAVQLLARAHQHVQRQRRDHHHKTAQALVRAYDTIYLEDLRVANLLRNHSLAKSIGDAGWYQFRSILACKAECAGKRAIAVPPQYTSQDCSGCGARVPKSLSVRTHSCPSCGLVLDRDVNAARNVLRAGQARQGAVALAAAVN